MDWTRALVLACSRSASRHQNRNQAAANYETYAQTASMRCSASMRPRYTHMPESQSSASYKQGVPCSSQTTLHLSLQAMARHCACGGSSCLMYIQQRDTFVLSFSNLMRRRKDTLTSIPLSHVHCSISKGPHHQGSVSRSDRHPGG